MVLLDKLWDDVVAGPQPGKGLGKLRRKHSGLRENAETLMERRRSGEIEARPITQSIAIKKPPMVQTTLDSSYSSISSASPSTPVASPAARERSIWRSASDPGQNRALKETGSARFDNVDRIVDICITTLV